MKKKLWLIPTTNSVLTGWLEHYKHIQDDFEIEIIIDSDLINNLSIMEDIKVQTNIQHYLMNQPNKIWKVINLLVTKKNIYLHLLKYKPDIIIVSNDIAFPQILYVKMAKKLGIKTVLHQHAGMMYPKNTKSYNFFKKIMKKLLGLSESIVLGTNVDEVWLMGDRWRNYVINDNIKIIGSCFYKNFKVRQRQYSCNPHKYFLEKKGFNDNDTLICFYSQPLYENSLLSLHIANTFYNDLFEIGNMLNSNGICFIIKRHPQEKLILSTNAKKYLIDEDDIDMWIDGADYSMSAYSQMLLQSKVNGNKTIGFMPDYIPSPQRTQMRESCDIILSEINKASINQLIEKLQTLTENINQLEEIVKTDIDCLNLKNIILEG